VILNPFRSSIRHTRWHTVFPMKKLRLLIIACLFALSISFPSAAQEKVTIVYQNDLHGWLFPNSTNVGISDIAAMLTPLFQREPNSFYAMSGDLFTGPGFPDPMKGVSELDIWNCFWEQLAAQGYGERVVISAGNHEFDYGTPGPDSFRSGLLCANLVTRDEKPYFTPYRVITSASGFRTGVIGLLLAGNKRVLKAIGDKGLKMVPMLSAVKHYVPEMGRLDLTVLMVHDHVQEIIELAEAIPPALGVDVILSGHSHVVLDPPLFKNNIYIFQAGAMNSFYGEAELMVNDGGITSVKNRIVKLTPSPLAHVSMLVKEAVDEAGGERFVVLKQSLLGASLRNQENSLGDFVTDAFRWATQTDVAMTNSSSLRRDFLVYPGESVLLNAGDFKTMCPFQNHLVVGKATGAQILQILEGDARSVSNQVSGIRYTADPRKPYGRRIVEAAIGGEPVSSDRMYTLAHNSFCASPENMEKYLHLKPGSIEWKETGLMDYQALIDFARQLKVIDYPSEGKGRIVRVP